MVVESVEFRSWIKARFEAAHKVARHLGKCRELHGHTYIVEVAVSSREVNELNMVIDFEELRSKLSEVLKIIDHKYLNEVLQEENVTAEFLALFIYRELSKRLPQGIKLAVVRVYENPDYWAEVMCNDR